MTKEQPDNLQGREEIVFDIYSQQIDREIDKYEQTCKRNQRNVTSRYESLPVVTSRNEWNQDKDKGKDKEKGKDKGEGDSKRARVRFIPPAVDEVQTFINENGYSVDAQRFVDFYASKGWMVGKSPMKDWKAAVRNWNRNNSGGSAAKPAPTNPALNYEQRTDDYSDIFVDLSQYGTEG
jgi:hypothetical protein